LGRLTLAVALIAMGALAVLGNVSAQVDPQLRHYLALAILVLGLGLLVGSLWGRAKWLALIGALMIPPLLVSPAAEFTAVEPNSNVDPLSFADLDTAYQTGVGSLRLDLTALPWDGQAIALEVDVGMGELELAVPADIAVEGRAQIGVGEMTTISQGEAVGRSSGFGIDRTINLPAVGGAGAGSVSLDSSVGMGSVRILQGDDFVLFRPGPGTVVVDSVENLQPEYQVRRGDFTLDLSNFASQEEFEQATSILVGIGNLTVIVPDEATVITEAVTGVGRIDIDGQTIEGQGAQLDYVMQGSDESQALYLDLKVGSGNITVERGERQ
jgi:predicted membrane protein